MSVRMRTAADGSLVIEGEGRVSVDTDLPPEAGMARAEGQDETFSQCPHCRLWCPVEAGELVHSDDQVVECVLKS